MITTKITRQTAKTTHRRIRKTIPIPRHAHDAHEDKDKARAYSGYDSNDNDAVNGPDNEHQPDTDTCNDHTNAGQTFAEGENVVWMLVVVGAMLRAHENPFRWQR